MISPSDSRTVKPTAQWAVAVIEPNRDFEADRILRRDGFRTVLLTYRKLLTGHRRAGWDRAGDFIPRPLFPGYLFVELWPDQPWPRMERGGFQGFISSFRKPLLLADEVVSSWRERMNAGEFDDKRPDPKATAIGKFVSANSVEERRRLLEARFAEMIGSQYAA